MGLGSCKDIKKNLRSYPLQQSLLNIRKEKERPPQERGGSDRNTMVPEGWDVEFLRQGFWHNSGGL